MDEGNALLEHVETDKQAADIFTKDLPPIKWESALALIGMEDTASGRAIACDPVSEETSDPLLDPSKKGGIIHSPKTIIIQGAAAACEIIDDLTSDSECTDPIMDQPHLRRTSAMVVKAAMSDPRGSNRTRPSSKLPGWGKLIDRRQ